MDALIAFRARAKCPPPERPRRIVRAAAAFAAAIFTLAAILISTGLATGTVVGAADNGDGSRLYCGAGLAPATPGGNSAWLGGVVLHFVPAARCPDPYPSLAQVLLDVVGTGSGADLRVLGALYALVFTAVAACAGWVATSRGVRRAVLLVPVIMPLWDSAFTRMLISTFSEPVGLLAAFTVACGIAAAVTRPVGWDRALMLGLLAVGAIGAAWAKPAYAPLALVAAAAAALSGGRRAWRASVATAAGIGVVSGALFIHLSSLQTRHYAAINSHNLVYTLALTEMPGSAPALGLPAAAQNAAGRAYYPAGPEGVPGADVVAAAPGAVRNRVLVELAEHPAAMVRALSVAVQATAGRELSYLPSRAWSPGMSPTPLGQTTGEQAADAAQLRTWLAGLPAPWWPGTVLIAGCVVGLVGLRRGHTLGLRAARLAGATAVAGLGLSAAALADGYFEIAKHVWLAAYMVDVTAWVLVVAGAAGVWTMCRRARTSPVRPQE
ncbi:hypothetical protein FHX82_005801 [Amycolatopsis bartoniae]|nr:hypothetical protein [Amycolatopsis bartoniae]MBB2938723.1 hypothetical protein [Amycolatopsis bartoniae]TVT11494.1 hypothetical protein FNH07_01335 [Amycolatopsis bartoniae]